MLSRFISNKMLSTSNKGLLNKTIFIILSLVRIIILKFSDPLICYKIGNYSLLLPFSHNLAFYIKKYPNYSSNLGRIAKLVNEKYHNLSIIDIGANVGDSIAIIKTEVDCPILCIEGNERFLKILEKNAVLFPNVHIEKAYVGNKTEHTTLRLKEEGGTAHLCEDKLSEIHIKTLPDILKNHQFFLKSKMLKIDTDGFDCIILRGSLDYLSVAKPIVFFEYDPFFLSKQNDDGLSIFTMLNSIGYKVAMVYDNFGEYMLSIELMNLHLLENIHNHFSDRGGKYYCDLCVFHSEDNDLFEKTRLSEIQFFKKTRR